MIKSVLIGVLGGMFLVGFYLLLMGFASGSLNYAFDELWRLKFWIIGLVLGFAIQVGLFSYLRDLGKAGITEKQTAAGSAVTSTAAMVACCAHHLTDVLPLLGLSIAAAFLAKYQEWFLALGILSNIFGIALMVSHLRKMRG